MAPVEGGGPLVGDIDARAGNGAPPGLAPDGGFIICVFFVTVLLPSGCTIVVLDEID